eukprot:gene15277-21360_t
MHSKKVTGGLRVKRFTGGRGKHEAFDEEEGVDIDQESLEPCFSMESGESQPEMVPHPAYKEGSRGARKPDSSAGNSVNRPSFETTSPGTQPHNPRSKPTGLMKGQTPDVVRAPRSGDTSSTTKFLAIGILVCFSLILYMNVQLDTTKEMLMSSKANVLDLEHQKNMLTNELTKVTSKLENLNKVKKALKGELEVLIGRYISLKKEKLSYSEAESLEQHSLQLEKMLSHLQNGLKELGSEVGSEVVDDGVTKSG